MTKVFKSKFLLGVACLVLAAVVAFVLLPGLYSAKAETITVQKLAREVSPGTVLTADMLTASEVGAYGLPDGLLQEQQEAIGKVASEQLHSGEFLSKAQLMDQDAYAASAERKGAAMIPGQCLVALRFPSTSSGLAGTLRPGDLVDVYESGEDEEGEVSIQRVLEKLPVADVLNSRLESVEQVAEAKRNALEDDTGTYDLEPAYGVFLCTEAQAQTLIRLERLKTLHLTLRESGGN